MAATTRADAIHIWADFLDWGSVPRMKRGSRIAGVGTALTENCDAFILFGSSQPGKFRRKTLTQNGPVFREQISGCPPAYPVEDAGHYVQEWGGPVALAAL